MRYLLPLMLLACQTPDRQLEEIGEWEEVPHSLELTVTLNNGDIDTIGEVTQD